MKNIVRKISQAVQMILLAPIGLPSKVMGILRYVALGIGLVEKVLEDHESNTEEQKQVEDEKLE